MAKRLISEARRVLRHRLTMEAGLLVSAQYIAAALNFGTNILVARWLGSTDYGLLAITLAYPTLIYSFSAVKSISVITRYVSEFRATGDKDKLRSAVKLGYGLDFLVSLLALMLVGATGWWVSRDFYHQPEIGWLMIVYAGSLPLFALTGTSWAVLSSWERFRWLALLDALHPFIKLFFITGFLLAGLGVAGVVIGMAFAQACVGLFMMVASTSLLRRQGLGLWWKSSLQPLASFKRELVSFFGWNYLLVTLSGVIAQIPVMLLGRLRGPEDAGFYRLAVSIGVVGSYVETSLGRMAYPILSARWSAGERERINMSLARWTLRGGLPASLLLLLAIPLLPFLVPLLFGPDYRPVVEGAQMVVLGVAISTALFWLNSFYYASGRFNLWVEGFAVYATFVIGCSWFVIQRWGFFGSAGLVAVGKIVFTFSMLAFFFRFKVKNSK